MLALGIDPGSQVTGYAVLRDEEVLEAGVFRLRGRCPAEKLLDLRSDLTQLLGRYPGLELAGVESPFVGRFLNAVVPLAQARGVILMCLAEAGVEVHDLAPALVKKLCGAGGRAGKGLVQAAVMARFKIGKVDAPPDAFDAVAAAHAVTSLALSGNLVRRKQGPPRTP